MAEREDALSGDSIAAGVDGPISTRPTRAPNNTMQRQVNVSRRLLAQEPRDFQLRLIMSVRRHQKGLRHQ